MENHKLMTLEEAILHCGEKSCGDSACALELKQLAEWLTELQQYRSIWKDNTELPQENVPIIACCSEYFDVIEGVFQIIDKDSARYKISDYGWGIVKKWAYLKDIFPYRCYFSDLNSPVRFNETRIKRHHSSNRELESHKAWEESLLYADRIRGYY